MSTNRLYLLLVFCFLFLFSGMAQTLGIGLMPIRVKFTEEERRTKLRLPTRENILKQYEKMYQNKGIAFYNETYKPLLEKEILYALEARDINVSQLKIDSSDVATLAKEQELFDLLFSFLGFSSEISFLKNGQDQMKNVSKTERIAKLTRYFGRKLERDYLIFFTFKGRHYPTRKEEKNKVIPQIAKGNIGIQFFIVEASTGIIVKKIDPVDLFEKSIVGKILTEREYNSSPPLRKKITVNRVEVNMNKIAKKAKRKIKKLD